MLSDSVSKSMLRKREEIKTNYTETKPDKHFSARWWSVISDVHRMFSGSVVLKMTFHPQWSSSLEPIIPV